MDKYLIRLAVSLLNYLFVGLGFAISGQFKKSMLTVLAVFAAIIIDDFLDFNEILFHSVRLFAFINPLYAANFNFSHWLRNAILFYLIYGTALWGTVALALSFAN